jgi:hypothetical protein
LEVANGIGGEDMKGLFLAGFILIILGVLGVVSGGFIYTKRGNQVDIGATHAATNPKETIPISPILSGLALVGGMALMVAGSRSKG